MAKYKLTYKEDGESEQEYTEAESLKEAMSYADGFSDQTQVWVWKLVKEGTVYSKAEWK